MQPNVLELIIIRSRLLESIWSGVKIHIAAVLALLLAFFDDVTQFEEILKHISSLIYDILGIVHAVLGHIHETEDRRYQEKEKDGHNDSYDHKPDTAPSLLLVFFFASCKNEKEYCADKRVDASQNDTQNHTGQNSQNDILKISIVVY